MSTHKASFTGGSSSADSTANILATLSLTSPASSSSITKAPGRRSARKVTTKHEFGHLHSDLSMALQTAYTIPNDILDPMTSSFGMPDNLITFATDDANIPGSAVGFIPYQPPSQPRRPNSPTSTPIIPNLTSIPHSSPSSHPPLSPSTSFLTADNVMEELRLASFSANSDLVASHQELTRTAATYKPYIDRYDNWWNQEQAARMANSPGTPYISSRPITATKVFWFIEHERTRPKLKRNSKEYEEGTTLGKSAIITSVSALESRRRLDEHLYPDDPEAKISLRTDNRIHTQEQAAKKNEVARTAKAQLLKAAGSSAGTYTHGELIKVSRFCLNHKNTYIGFSSLVRDRAMLNLSTGTCFRGDNVREVLLSDLFLKEVPFPELGEAATVKALMVLTDNAKHNANGRVDETGAFRHRDVDLCPIGALGLHLFFLLQASGGPNTEPPSRPQFEPDFSDAAKAEGFGQYGKRPWYFLKLFPGSKGATEPMTYQNHHDRVKYLQTKNNVNVTAVTHVARGYAATNSRQHRASESDVKSLGGWNVGESSYKACYERSVPVGAMLGAANFNAQRPGDYRLPRASLIPPSTLLEGIFPWAEDELATLNVRTQANPSARDLAAENFLDVLIYLRTVLLQDMALIYETCPTSYLFTKVSPFNTDTFQTFATTAPQHVTHAKETARLALEDVPVHLKEGLCNSLAVFGVSQAEHATLANQRILSLERELTELKNIFADRALHGNANGRPKAKRACNAPSPPPPPPPLPLPPLIPSSTSPGVLSSPTRPSNSNFTLNISFSDPFNANPSPQLSVSAPSAQRSAYGAHPPSTSSDRNSTHQMHPSFAPSANQVGFPAAAPVPNEPIRTDEQRAGWEDIQRRYSASIIVAHKPWDWIDDAWVPTYLHFTRNAAISVGEVWKEYSVGINGHLGTQELLTVWNSKWKRGEGKSEWTRRNKVVKLIKQLTAARPNWTPEISLRFLRERYQHYKSARTLADALSAKKITLEQVLAEAKTWNP